MYRNTIYEGSIDKTTPWTIIGSVEQRFIELDGYYNLENNKVAVDGKNKYKTQDEIINDGKIPNGA